MHTGRHRKAGFATGAKGGVYMETPDIHSKDKRQNGPPGERHDVAHAGDDDAAGNGRAHELVAADAD